MAAQSAPAFTSSEVGESALHRRAVEAIIWGMPLVNTDAMRQAYFRDVGATYNDICYFSRPADWRFQVTTPNASTNYVYFNFNLKDGPVVLEVPPAAGAGLLGALIDAWDVTTAGIGPEDENHGKAAKYLLLPPDFRGAGFAGFISVRFPTYNGYSLIRAIPGGSAQADIAASLALVKKLRVYSLAEVANPPEQRFIDIHGKTFEGVASFDERFFESLARMVQEEPVLPRDLVAMGMLKSIGIEKGKPFKPDAGTQRVFKEAARETLAAFVEGMRTFGAKWWADGHWRFPDIRGVKTNFSYETADALDVDARGLSNFAAFGFPKRVGQGGSVAYIIAFVDHRGAPLSGEHTYILRVPANVPAKQYWSAVAYDSHTNAFVREAPVVTLDSYNQTMKKNADGSVDILFGPKPPAGEEANWIYTAPGRGWFCGFRLYDPDKRFFDKTWRLADIEKTAAGQSQAA